MPGKAEPKPGATTVATTKGHATTTDPNFIEGIINNIPLPQWALIAIAAGVGVLLIIIACIAICCCCRKKKKSKSKAGGVSMGGGSVNLISSQVQPDMDDLDSRVQKQKGRLLYSLEYNYRLEELVVTLKEAQDLMGLDSSGNSDPYAIVFLTNNRQKKEETKVHRRDLNPTFNETFRFPLPKSEEKETSVVIQLFDFNRFSKHDSLGELRLSLADIDLQRVIEEWADLTVALKTEQEHLGDICFSLRYVPSTSKMTVVILEAKKLKRMDADGFSDPYVKVQLILNKKKWKKKKTTVKKKTLAPYFNEAFNFEVPFELIQNVDLVISVWDHDTVTKNNEIGKLRLGCRASGNQLRHWSDMLSNPRRPVAQWHSLQPVDEVNQALGVKSRFKLPLPRS